MIDCDEQPGHPPDHVAYGDRRSRGPAAPAHHGHQPLGQGQPAVVRLAAATGCHPGAVRRVAACSSAQRPGRHGRRRVQRPLPLLRGLKLYLFTAPDGMPIAWCLKGQPGLKRHGAHTHMASSRASASGRWAWPPPAGATGPSTRPTSAASSPTTTDYHHQGIDHLGVNETVSMRYDDGMCYGFV